MFLLILLAGFGLLVLINPHIDFDIPERPPEPAPEPPAQPAPE